MAETKKNSSGSAAETKTKYGVVITDKPNDLSPLRREVLLNCSPEEGLTEQSHAADCDINNIVKRHSAADLAAVSSAQPGIYDDFSSVTDYKEAIDVVMRAQDQFDALPSGIREKFANDPARFLAFATDAKNAEEMVTLGLAEKPRLSDSQELKNAINGLSESVKGSKHEPDPKK